MGIETYLFVAYWLGLVGIVLKGLIMLVADYPRTVKFSSASDTMQILVSIFFFAWVCYLRFYA